MRSGVGLALGCGVPGCVPVKGCAPGPRSPSAGKAQTSRATAHDPLRGQRQAGSLTGAVHLSKGNVGVLRPAQRGQKPRVEQKGKCWLDPDFQYEYGPRKRGLSILKHVARLLRLKEQSMLLEVSEKLPQG